jgi:Protein of unknown function (DUF1822)
MMSTFTTPMQWHLEIPDEIARSAWKQSQSCPTPRAQWNSYLNQVCKATLLPWLQLESDLAVTTYPEAIESLWELVSGTGIVSGGRRLVLIPDKSFDRDLSVPQEWVDHPEWAGDYYLAVQVNPDEQWLDVWGYTTQALLKAQGTYNANDRTYHLDADQLIQDLNVLSVVQQMNPQELTQAENLLQRLASANTVINTVGNTVGNIVGNIVGNTVDNTITNLSQWLQNTFESGWQTLESLLGSEAEAAFAFRQTATIEAPAIRRVKALRLPARLLLLLVAVDADGDDRMGVRVQVRSGDETLALPLGLMISLHSASGEVIQRVQSRGEDLAVQLQRFRCPTGTQFWVTVRVGEQSIEEQFRA